MPRAYDPVPGSAMSGYPEHELEGFEAPPAPRFLSEDSSPSASRPSFGSQGTADESSVRILNAGRQSSDPGIYGMTYYRDDPGAGDANMSQQTLGNKSPGSPRSPYLNMSEKPRGTYASPRTRSRRRALLIVGGVAAAIVIVVVVVAVYFSVHNKNSSDAVSGSTSKSGSSSASPSQSSGSKSGGATSNIVVTGGDGSTVTMSDGTTFTYSNPYGGYWYYDPSEPLKNYARAQSWTPAMNESFEYGTDIIRGVNLGGWLVTEPFISPALFEPYANTSFPAVDEWTLSENLGNDTSAGGLQGVLENHYATFITEQDFAEIAGAGLNHVRIPLPYWAIETWEGEPFLARVSWTYFLKAIEWARKYGLRINLDFHCLPGSQNGWNHSGKLGSINVLNGPMGLANAQRSLSYIKIIAEFISQPQYSSVVTIFGITNEPFGPTIGQAALETYYVQAYEYVRLASGIGAGNGPYVLYHDGFFDLSQWVGFMTGADRIAIDIHPYVCFAGQSSEPYSARLSVPCDTWGADQNVSMEAFGLTTAGEWSNAINDCGLWVNGVNEGTRYEGDYPGYSTRVGSCDEWTDWQNWNATFKASIEDWALASMSALQNWFFWTWKIGNSSVTGVVESPQWSYQLGLQNGWMPADPRSADGVCSPTSVFTPPLSAWQTGGAGAGTVAASASAYAWPPSVLSNSGFSQTSAAAFPAYTPTGSQVTLAPPTFTESVSGKTETVSASAGDGWENASDTQGKYVPVATCNYLFPWIGPTDPPSPLCSSAAARREEVVTPTPTPAPR
ncbi:glycoside hydrolase family 5 protein [Wolfiporia cocos MD-104 SS10]|uniref:glucan 1,3-beta-glucosidase n=1 Tax=Wolfiporia cocos (strain MD-104) TaxID=742152 RepID=A0A2H3J7B4_WOLCO|nr:glycoside hydrolase family 5 protein [Wolfiporia cocos MD-104 SS10]